MPKRKNRSRRATLSAFSSECGFSGRSCFLTRILLEGIVMFFKKKEEKPGGSLHALSLRDAVMHAVPLLIVSLATYVWGFISIAEISDPSPERFKPIHPGLYAIVYMSGAWALVVCPMIECAVILFGAWRGILFYEIIFINTRFIKMRKLRLKEALKHPSFPPALRRWYSYTHGIKPFLAFLFLSLIATTVGLLYWQDDLTEFLIYFFLVR